MELKPCPFCGCSTVNAVEQDDKTKWHECDWCKAVGPIEQPEADPPEGWNYRAPAPRDEAIRALMEALIDAQAGLDYVEAFHGKLSGVGFERCKAGTAAALAKVKETGK